MWKMRREGRHPVDVVLIAADTSQVRQSHIIYAFMFILFNNNKKTWRNDLILHNSLHASQPVSVMNETAEQLHGLSSACCPTNHYLVAAASPPSAASSAAQMPRRTIFYLLLLLLFICFFTTEYESEVRRRGGSNEWSHDSNPNRVEQLSAECSPMRSTAA